jgi:hypothetical protein
VLTPAILRSRGGEMSATSRTNTFRRAGAVRCASSKTAMVFEVLGEVHSKPELFLRHRRDRSWPGRWNLREALLIGELSCLFSRWVRDKTHLEMTLEWQRRKSDSEVGNESCMRIRTWEVSLGFLRHSFV